VVLTGGEECLMEGMRSFVRSQRKVLDPETTYVLNLDAVGDGHVRYAISEGAAVSFALDKRLAELCEAIASADREDGDRYRAEPIRRGIGSDAVPARLAGIPSMTITALRRGDALPETYRRPEDVPDAVDADSLDRAHDFTLELIRQLDRDAGRRARKAAPNGEAKPKREEAVA
jgi:Zn-dependent M28 family amino/carboxypeptidase